MFWRVEGNPTLYSAGYHRTTR